MFGRRSRFGNLVSDESRVSYSKSYTYSYSSVLITGRRVNPAGERKQTRPVWPSRSPKREDR